MNSYQEFIASKSHSENLHGFDPIYLPEGMFDFQSALAEWAIRKGRAAIFADCGMGKTLLQLTWADNVVRHSNKPVLIATPLAVGQQTVKEAAKFGFDASRCGDGNHRGGIVVTNYERLHHFNPGDFAGMVCDESSILKNFDGAIKQSVTEFMKKMQYRLLCTATAAPNDYIELGTSSEALGELGYMDMLGMFFKNDQNSLHPSNRGRGNVAWYGCKWRFKHHAERPFWRWVCSWARACRKPSDLGFDDRNMVLPPLEIREHVVDASRPMPGMLFTMPAKGLTEQRQERKHTIRERCEALAELLTTNESAVAWCHLNPEGDLLTKLIPGAVQVSGKDSDEAKEEKFMAFQSGEIRCLVTKPKIGAFGLNWQHCRHMGFFPSHSFEQYYQGIRRCWRFGQKKTVRVDVVSSSGETDVISNLKRKSEAADKMFSVLVDEMNQELRIDRSTKFTKTASPPSWLLACNPSQGVSSNEYV